MRIAFAAERILAGEQVFQSLAAAPGPLDLTGDRFQRGGKAFILDIETLRLAPNPSPAVGGRPSRRSDMLWALLQQRCFGRRVRAMPIAPYHDRSRVPAGTLDVERIADDALIGERVLDRLAVEYERGADVTVGSMLRTDKAADYPVCFDRPRERRGGNVWQHLRSFRKRLFDAIPDDALRLDGGYVDVATDWAFMLPIVEMAEHPVHIAEPLYLYEPSGVGKGAERTEREATIARIVAKAPAARGRSEPRRSNEGIGVNVRH